MTAVPNVGADMLLTANARPPSVGAMKTAADMTPASVIIAICAMNANGYAHAGVTSGIAPVSRRNVRVRLSAVHTVTAFVGIARCAMAVHPFKTVAATAKQAATCFAKCATRACISAVNVAMSAIMQSAPKSSFGTCGRF